MYNSYYGYPNFTNIPLRSAPMPYVPTRSFTTPLLSSRISPLLTRSATAPSALQTATKSFSWSNLLNGASRTIGVINQAIPVVNQVKPIVNNVRTMFKVVKELNKTEPTTETTRKEKTNTEDKQDNTQKNNTIENDNQPKFFV